MPDDSITPAPDGLAVAFTVFRPYAPGTLSVRVDLIPVAPDDLRETDPAAGLFTLVSAPRADQLMEADFDPA